jgi:hypothetical protein
MAQDFAKRGAQGGGRRKSNRGTASRKRSAARAPAGTHPGSGWKWYGAGVLTGVFLSFLVYLGTLPPAGPAGNTPSATELPVAESVPPKPRFDFYKMLPEQSIEVDVEPAPVAASGPAAPAERYLLQAGSFRQQQDADARRAELLLLGLEPRIEEASGDNGRWYRVYLGPFDSRAGVARARSLTAAQGIDTLLLKRTAP